MVEDKKDYGDFRVDAFDSEDEADAAYATYLKEQKEAKAEQKAQRKHWAEEGYVPQDHVPEIGHTVGQAVDPDQAEAENKAKLAKNEVHDLVKAKPDPKPRPTRDMQPGPAEFDPNTEHKTVDERAR